MSISHFSCTPLINNYSCGLYSSSTRWRDRRKRKVSCLANNYFRISIDISLVPFIFIIINIFTSFWLRHEDLLNSNGVYADMWDQQSKKQKRPENNQSSEDDKEIDNKMAKNKGIGKNGGNSC